jgi:hypothetical protein
VLFARKREFERTLYDATHATVGIVTEVGHPFISDVAGPGGAVPSAILIPAGPAFRNVVPFGCDSIAKAVCTGQH